MALDINGIRRASFQGALEDRYDVYAWRFADDGSLAATDVAGVGSDYFEGGVSVVMAQHFDRPVVFAGRLGAQEVQVELNKLEGEN